MTPAARVAAAIDVLDNVAGGLAAEQALTRWARGSRFAGSKDRAAVRDHVFEVMRCRRSAAHFGGGNDGRALMIGLLRQRGADLSALFSGDGYGPAALTEAERTVPLPPDDVATSWNLPDWLVPRFIASLGADAARTAQALQARAPITLRVNLHKTTRDAAAEMLLVEGIATAINPLADSALTVAEGDRKIRNSRMFSEGYVELQDAASQAVAALVPPGARVLDYCAGGGGKALVLAGQSGRRVFAHDVDLQRMTDLPARAARAGVAVSQLATAALADHAPFDVVVCDAPCSGSGAWRRAPEGKWTLTEPRLAELTGIQDAILDAAAGLTAAAGTLVYATCSVLAEENEARVAAFLARHAGWRQTHAQRFAVDDHGDGFFTAHLTRNQTSSYST